MGIKLTLLQVGVIGLRGPGTGTIAVAFAMLAECGNAAKCESDKFGVDGTQIPGAHILRRRCRCYPRRRDASSGRGLQDWRSGIVAEVLTVFAAKEFDPRENASKSLVADHGAGNNTRAVDVTTLRHG